MRRRPVAFVLTLFFVMGLVACSGGTSGGNSGDPGAGVAPTITTQLSNQTVTAGQQATFTVVATGSAPLSYQWQMGTSNIVGAPNSPSYTTPATSTNNNGETFRVIVSNGVNPPATSNSATLTVNPAAVAPSITTQPTNQTVTAGQTATFMVVATGTAPLSYQWQSAPSGSSNYANIAGAVSASYSLTNTTTAQSGMSFRVVVSNGVNPPATSNSATLTVNPAAAAPSITTQPTNQTVNAGQTATFMVVATGTAPLSYQWQSAPSGSSNYANIAGAVSASYSLTNTTTAQSGMSFRVVVSNGVNPPATSDAATLTVNPTVAGSKITVLTYHNDVGRTGQNLNETTLTTSNVNTATFGKLGTLAVTGLVDAEPLYVGGLNIKGATHNVVFVATEQDMVYAFDADTPGPPLWSVSVIPPNTEMPAAEVDGCSEVAPVSGITATPVIDPSAGPHGTIFVVAMSVDSSGDYHQRLHALDLTTGADLIAATDIQATFPNLSGTTTFDPEQYQERTALLLLNNVIYLAWTSQCDTTPYQGWVMGYSEPTLKQVSVLNVTPNGSQGAIWMSGDGLAADSSGNIYFLDANGTFDTTLVNGLPNKGDYGNAFIKLSTAGNSLAVADYFTMFDTVNQSNSDADLGSGGVLVLPDLVDANNKTWHLAVGAGKPDAITGKNVIYVVNRDSMGRFNPVSDTGIYQEFTPGISEVASTPAYFNGVVYYGPQDDDLEAFNITNALLETTPSSHSPEPFGYPGVTPSVSANGTANGIVWGIENGSSTGVLRAYDAANLASELYNSNQAAGGRDNFSTNSNCKFVTPMIANGKVYVGTPGAVVVFGLLP